MHKFWLAALFAAYSLVVGGAEASDRSVWPAQPITLILGAPPDSDVDVLAQLLRGSLERELRTPLDLTHMPGQDGGFALDYVAKARADGYTLLLSIASVDVASATFGKKPVDIEADLIPLAAIRLLGTISQQPGGGKRDVRSGVAAVSSESPGTDWLMLSAPKGINSVIAEKIGIAVQKTIELPTVHDKMRGTGLTLQHAAVQEFRTAINGHRAAWHDVADATLATPEPAREPEITPPSPTSAKPVRRTNRATKGAASPNWMTQIWR